MGCTDQAAGAGGIYMPGTEKESGNLIPEDSHFLYGGTKSLLKKPVV